MHATWWFVELGANVASMATEKPPVPALNPVPIILFLFVDPTANPTIITVWCTAMPASPAPTSALDTRATVPSRRNPKRLKIRLCSNQSSVSSGREMHFDAKCCLISASILLTRAGTARDFSTVRKFGPGSTCAILPKTISSMPTSSWLVLR